MAIKITYNSKAGPLVSIIVVTYNSSKYVLETLESAKAQTYHNIELIVSDDCSTDDTVEICRKWMEENKKRFINNELITIEKNTGIPANCNRGVKSARGEWVKLIAGDDALMETCIEDYVNYINNSKEIIYAMHSNTHWYDTHFSDSNYIYTTDRAQELITHPLLTAKEQLSLIVWGVRGSGPSTTSVMYRKDIITAVGGFDETLPYEDVPMYIKLLENNFKFHFLNVVNVKYRVHNESMTHPGQMYLYDDFYLKEKQVFEKIHCRYFKLPERMLRRIEFYRKHVFHLLKLNRNTLLNYRLDVIFSYPVVCYRKYLLSKVNAKIKKRLSLEQHNS